MVKIIHIEDDQHSHTFTDYLNDFKQDIKTGLEKEKKHISSKYLYDEYGSELFNQITRHPDYYLTRTEIEILTTHKSYLSEQIGKRPFNLVELGPGEGIKTEILINQFLDDSLTFSYIPIDISSKYLKVLLRHFQKKIPGIESTALHSDYFAGLEWLSKNSDRRNVVLFLGSSIGNFDTDNMIEFIRHLHASLNEGDLVLIGFDLCKDKDILMRAYNDSDGITRKFNFNLLNRINVELGANFNVEKFHHHPTYNVLTGAMESYLISLEQQSIDIMALEQSFQLNEAEPIHVEFSNKYQLSFIESSAGNNGFKIIRNLADSQHYFVDSLWQVIK